ncbi:hypothetical protein AURDEDRAFT_112146 [Auricularia subglabra TFB-10046 SS5]|nr:hypothetical protein AURDEDRAFT_112146 [Auricularia subglabra TFB-10046 SS5]
MFRSSDADGAQHSFFPTSTPKFDEYTVAAGLKECGALSPAVSRANSPAAVEPEPMSPLNDVPELESDPSPAGKWRSELLKHRDFKRGLITTLLLPYLGFLMSLIMFHSPPGMLGAQIGMATLFTLQGLIELLLLVVIPTQQFALHVFLGCGALAMASLVWVRVFCEVLVPVVRDQHARTEGQVRLEGEDILREKRLTKQLKTQILHDFKTMGLLV